MKEYFFKMIRYIPSVRRKIDDEISKISTSIEADVIKRTEGLKYFTKLPYNGMNKEEIIDLVDRYVTLGNYKWKEGRVSGAVYNYSNDLAELVAAVYQRTSYTNPLHPDIFPGINKMEAEVVRMSLVLFKGSLDSVGTVSWKFWQNVYKINIFILNLLLDDNWRYRVYYNGMQSIPRLRSGQKRHYQTKYSFTENCTFGF